MTEPTPDLPTAVATTDDILLVLGKLGPRVAQNPDIDLEAFLSLGHAAAVTRLVKAYGTRTLPTFTGDAAEALRWAEAKLAAADILDIVRVTLGSDVSEVPERLRRSAWEALDHGLPGVFPGDPVPPDPDAPPLPTWTTSPAHSSDTPVSNFADPYAYAERPLPVRDLWG